VDEDRDRGRDEEAVPEGGEAVARAPVEPREEDPGEEEVPDEVEDVQALDEARDVVEKRLLQLRLPSEREPVLQVDDPSRVRRRLPPVRRHRQPRELVHAHGGEHDRDLGQAVASLGERTARC
jgi:hypothetical protein